LRATLVDQAMKVILDDVSEMRQEFRDRSEASIHDQIDGGSRPLMLEAL